ncbi:hypothetical protein [Xenorhabdus sp. IM139775]|uniref:hypothetical protein n=1 Tax=Xenorhabdus sp. IM139775 TaxID=3025876 RepID=UPI002358E4F4|nr:hypothetical protein [Xenorhabdus sp. IM139775]MDC9594434.1 hypothetical protein [Xenorhabdus sp. IM139775]
MILSIEGADRKRRILFFASHTFIIIHSLPRCVYDTHVDPPHVEYYLIGLDVEKMRYHAGEIYKGKRYGNSSISHSYNSINKNCATMVAKILKAGGVENLLNPVQRIGYGKNIYWTPKDIAQLCNELRNNDKAVKVKGLDCPNKLDLPFKTLMGFR